MIKLKNISKKKFTFFFGVFNQNVGFTLIFFHLRFVRYLSMTVKKVLITEHTMRNHKSSSQEVPKNLI